MISTTEKLVSDKRNIKIYACKSNHSSLYFKKNPQTISTENLDLKSRLGDPNGATCTPQSAHLGKYLMNTKQWNRITGGEVGQQHYTKTLGYAVSNCNCQFGSQMPSGWSQRSLTVSPASQGGYRMHQQQYNCDLGSQSKEEEGPNSKHCTEGLKGCKRDSNHATCSPQLPTYLSPIKLRGSTL